MADEDNLVGLKGDERILREAKDRHKRAMDRESDARKVFLEDIKFDAADSDNGYMWPNANYLNAWGDDKPRLTINTTHTHNRHIINEGKQNTPAVKVRAVGDGATARSAEVFNGVIRHIEYDSNAKSAYSTAFGFAVRGGIGYIRIMTDFVGDNTFDQKLVIRRVKDPLSILLDPDINEEDGSDARWGFAFEDPPRDEVLREYPKLRDKLTADMISGNDGWTTEGTVRVAEYYRKVQEKDYLVLMTEPALMPDGVTENPNAGQQKLVKASDIGKALFAIAKALPDSKIREIATDKVEWFKIVGDEIVDRRVGEDALPVPYIPIVRVIGEETIIEGKIDRKGNTRALKDPNRMLNYNASAFIEFGALQSKSPYMAPVRAIKGQETYWRTANTVNHSVLPYNDLDNEGKPIAAPQRQQPPMSAPVYMQGMTASNDWSRLVSGQWQSDMGQPGNERSGKAINARALQGDTATYNYTDSWAMAISLVGKILIAWFPKVYDTARVMRILGEDGTEEEIRLDPQAKEALSEKKDRQMKVVESIFNPNVGRYSVVATAGPGYATRRQEEFNALSQIVASNPAVMQVAGDYLFRAMDTPYAEEIAERYERSIPANIKGEGPGPEVDALKKELENVKGLLTDVVTELAEKDLELKGARADKSVNAYNAETKRVVDVAKVAGDAPALQALIMQAVQQALDQQWPPAETTGSPSAEPMPNGAEADLPPMQDMPMDIRAQVDATLSNGNPNG